MTDEITMETIKKAIFLIHNPEIIYRQNYDWGWVDFDISHKPLEIGLNEKTHTKVIGWMNSFQDKQHLKNGYPITFYGIPIYKTNMHR